MTAKLDEMIKIASAASKGPWRRHDTFGLQVHACGNNEYDGLIGNMGAGDDAEYLEAFNPAVMLPLLHAMKGMMEALEHIDEFSAWHNNPAAMALAAARKAVGHE